MGLKLLSTGIPGLDKVFGGGLPEYSFNLVAGPPGAGKTTLVHQLTFANASAERPALYFTVLGEPSLKMLRYQQQMGFFDPEKVGTVIRFIDLSREVMSESPAALLDSIVKHVEQTNPAIVVVDSFRTVMRSYVGGDMELQAFLQRLALHLTSWQVTSFLVGEYEESEMHSNPVFTIADGIFWLTHNKERNTAVRKIEVIKMRGQAAIPGRHTFRISQQGIEVFPRTMSRLPVTAEHSARRRVSVGVPGLDEMMGGGVITGDATLVAGPSGTGKTAVSIQFAAEGVRHGEPAVLALFEEHPEEFVARAKEMGVDFEAMARQQQLRLLYFRLLDLSADEILHEVQQAVAQIGARRLVIDSLNGLELALSPGFREDFRESLYRMIGALTGGGVSILLTVEVTESFDKIHFSPHTVSFLAHNIILLRYAEIDGQLRKVLTVAKMRRSQHSPYLHAYEITSSGMRVTEPITGYRGFLTGVPTPRRLDPAGLPGLIDRERAVLDQALALREATAERLAEATGMELPALSRALARLVELNYLIEVQENGSVLYRSIARPLGQ
ncbi:ATPase domain-containing protein [Sorangium cellulosum]|uniref:ATPase domain-containing protein n=1 Tax=Sorangium TaxID=39643 RepID=UPI0007C7A75F|nr:ATPase domain-containing protein [Sorangium cellulosum]